MSSSVEKPKKEDVFMTVEVPEAAKKLGTGEVEKIPEVSPKDQIKEVLSSKREDTRGRLALIFVFGFFAILTISSILAGLSEGNKVDNLKEALITVSGILSGPLGFVIGYYFRKQEEE